MDKEIEEKLPLVLDLNKKEIQVQGYYVQDIQQYLTNKEFIDFNKFMNGQTVAIVNNKQLIYKHDFDRWKVQYNERIQ